ncbi:YlbD family protein [Cytobacillus spongiae]|jgi:hypothetical protein|uniref:YlbD family protein n=1 Tax=Cytobacillus spongiae TaxID=2901381 RepID=UPI001F40EA30|nr:YlbD family protein [Cytobacillus spongiae]UII57288.1 YlbD family protein [Cytobacillus spongiae]
MSKKQLHPSVREFKVFVKNHPHLIQEVRTGKSTWQEMYEEWYLLGEEDPRWSTNRSEEKAQEEGLENSENKKSDWISQVMGAVKTIDPNQIQGHISSISQALAAVQGVITQFQGNNQGSTPSSNKNQAPKHPFMFRKD